MEAELVFNDLSITTAPSEEVARQWLTDMMGTIADLIDEEINGKSICKRMIRTNRDFYEIDLTEDYGYIEWSEDTQVPRELRNLAQYLDARSPVEQDLKNKTKVYDEFLGSEFVLKQAPEKDAIALGVTLLHDGIAVSLPSEPRWCQPKIEIVQKLYEENRKKPHQINHQVRQISHPDQVDCAIRNWQQGLSQKIKEVHELVEQWEMVFSHLDWCQEYEQKMLPYLENKKTLESVLQRLWQLDEACHHWNSQKDSTPSYPMNVRPESGQTKKNQRLKKMRQAHCPHHREKLQLFEWHCNIDPKGYRLYWLVNKNLCRITICYIGPHLETSRFKSQ